MTLSIRVTSQIPATRPRTERGDRTREYEPRGQERNIQTNDKRLTHIDRKHTPTETTYGYGYIREQRIRRGEVELGMSKKTSFLLNF